MSRKVKYNNLNNDGLIRLLSEKDDIIAKKRNRDNRFKRKE